MIKFITDISELSSSLFGKAMDCLTHNSQFIYDQTSNEIRKNENPPEMIVVNSGAVKYWIIFSIGIEMLVKSVLVKHDCLPFRKKPKNEDQLEKSASNYDDCLKIYREFVGIFSVSATNNPNIDIRLKKENIGLLYELNLGTLGSCKRHLACLKDKGILSSEEWANVFNAIQTLLDVRRNFDAHNYSNLSVVGSINGDLDDLYLPAINILLKK